MEDKYIRVFYPGVGMYSLENGNLIATVGELQVVGYPVDDVIIESSSGQIINFAMIWKKFKGVGGNHPLLQYLMNPTPPL